MASHAPLPPAPPTRGGGGKSFLRSALRGLLLAGILTLVSGSPGNRAEAADTLYEALITTLKFPARLEQPMALLQDLVDAQNDGWAQAVAPLGTPDATSAALRAPEFPWLAEAAIADYREALRQDFISRVGRPDDWCDVGILTALAARGRLPGRAGAADYLAAHDRDRDNRLTLDEFVPSAEEVARTEDLKSLVSSFVHGIPYPTGQSPVASATAFGLAPAAAGLFTTAREIEQRIEGYASRIGGTTYRRPDGRLGARDAAGQAIDPLPEDIVPLHKLEAESRLTRFVSDLGGTADFAPDRPPVLRDAGGAVLPMEKWPPFTQPPYHPEEGPPPPPPPGP